MHNVPPKPTKLVPNPYRGVYKTHSMSMDDALCIRGLYDFSRFSRFSIYKEMKNKGKSEPTSVTN